MAVLAVDRAIFPVRGGAWEIIKSEAESYKGITFSRNTPPVLEDVKLPESRLFSGKTEKISPSGTVIYVWTERTQIIR